MSCEPLWYDEIIFGFYRILFFFRPVLICLQFVLISMLGEDVFGPMHKQILNNNKKSNKIGKRNKKKKNERARAHTANTNAFYCADALHWFVFIFTGLSTLNTSICFSIGFSAPSFGSFLSLHDIRSRTLVNVLIFSGKKCCVQNLEEKKETKTPDRFGSFLSIAAT